MKKFLSLLLCLASALSANAADEKLRQAMEKALAGKGFIDRLTAKDIPEEWKSRKEVKETEKSIIHTYTRGGVKLLEVQWLKAWTGDKEKLFGVQLYHGDKKLIEILRLRDSTILTPSEAPKGYDVYTSIKDEGGLTVLVSNDDAGFLEVVEVQGRQTHLADDLEYTKAVLSNERMIKPLLDALKEAADTKTKQAKEPAKHK